ncbi:hypothetical protein JRQ81_005906 [Phrynocephalus forsythii]|uniref:ENTH domain-containing protein n=1 Tax=Phrynocephalus forsythii TaxID=171643 RepID=A0A9Q1AW03_9SAUR|nr:hypothetical protein JRQ81_005906 [Phrynocephalus forsythii]
MSTSSLRRQMKNIVHNYSEAEIKVREATSNDPWGPSSSLMSEIADLTYNVVAFSEIMSMIWKRLNDHGKNWRHVYKAMTLMEYLIKTGSERVAQQCKENIYAIQTLKDFQYVDRDGKDQGVNVREKAKQLVALLKDDERLKEERAHALKTKEKLAQTATASSASSSLANAPVEAEQAWPQSSGEEELQLQLALAMSKEEAEQVSTKPPAAADEDLQLQLALSLSKEEHDKEERIRRGDDLRLQMAIEESKKETVPAKEETRPLLPPFSSDGDTCSQKDNNGRAKVNKGLSYRHDLQLCPGKASPIFLWPLSLDRAGDIHRSQSTLQHLANNGDMFQRAAWAEPKPENPAEMP